MSSFNTFRSAVCAALCLLGVGSASAALFDRGGGLIYDSDLNITWLQDANYAKTSSYDVDGQMSWTAANTWAANLVYHDSVRNVDYSDWRLPTALNQDNSAPCAGYSCTGSEMGHLFYTEGGLSADFSILSSAILDANFTNMQSYAYWSGTASAPYPADAAWLFFTNSGFQSYTYQHDLYNAWAVRPGDVAAIPEPETYAMLLAGLSLLGFMARRRKQKETAA